MTGGVVSKGGQIRVRLDAAPDRALKNRTVRPKAGRMATLVVTLKKKHNCCAAAHRRPNGGSYELSYVFYCFNSSAHNYCPVLFIITQKCGVQVDPIRSASRIRSESRGFAVWVIYVVT